jgi:GAF domain-containing protein
MLVDILEVQRAVLYMYEPKEETFYSKIVTSESPVQVVIDKTMGHFRFVEEALIINKACEDPRFDIKYDRLSSFITTNLVCYPLKLHNTFIGFLECSNKSQDFTKEDMILLSQVSKQLAIGISGYTTKNHLKNLSLNARLSGHIQHSKDSLILPILNKILTNCKVLINCEARLFSYTTQTLMN